MKVAGYVGIMAASLFLLSTLLLTECPETRGDRTAETGQDRTREQGESAPAEPKATTQPKAAPIFYPPLPSRPRLQFLTGFSDATKWTGRGGRERAGAKFDMPYGLGVRGGKLYICDVGAKVVHILDLKNKTCGTLGKPGQLKNPVNITFGPGGLAYVCDTRHRKVAVFDARDTFVKYLGDPDKCAPIDLAIMGKELLIADVANGEVEVWSAGGKFLRVLAQKGKEPGQLNRPTNLAVTPDRSIAVSDTTSSVVNVYDRKGKYLRSVGAPGDLPGFFARPKGLAVDANGILYVVDAQWQSVQMFSPKGKFLMLFGEPGRTPGSMSIPACIIIDKTLLPLFASYVDPSFKADYLVFVSNQYDKNKIGVYAFGRRPLGQLKGRN